MNLSRRELCTVLAALSYWGEEMLPHGRRIMQPYFRDLGFPRTSPLNRTEVQRLAQRLRVSLTRR